MKSVQLKDVQQYKDSDQWLYEEVSATLLICFPLQERQKNNNTEVCQSSNYLHTETEAMKIKKFDDTNIENPVNNARNQKDILQNNDLYSICLFLHIQLVKG